MMTKNASNGPARPKKSTKSKLPASIWAPNPQRRLDEGLRLIADANERVFSIRDLAKGFRIAARTPQVRVPKTRWSRSKSTTVPTQRIRDLCDDSFSHVLTMEGSLEPIFLKQCELDARIEKTLAQPFIVDFEGYLGLGKFTMDFACYPHFGKPYAVDVKNDAALNSPKYKLLVEARKRAFIDHGFELRTYTEDDLKVEPKSSNIIRLYSCLNRDPKVLKRATKSLKEALLSVGGEAYLDAFTHLPAKTVKWGTAYGLYTGQISVDHKTAYGSDFRIKLENTHD
jgi:hypothetical protein